MSEKHESFVKSTRTAFLGTLAQSEPYKVGSWFRGPSRPDLLIIWHPSTQAPKKDEKVHLNDWKDNVFVIECKVSKEDIRRAFFQLVLAEAAFPRDAGLDLAHGGMRLVLAIPKSLKERLEFLELFEELKSLYRSIHFGLAIVDEKAEKLEWVLWSESFM
jgi:hypothetical protein